MRLRMRIVLSFALLAFLAPPNLQTLLAQEGEAEQELILPLIVRKFVPVPGGLLLTDLTFLNPSSTALSPLFTVYDESGQSFPNRVFCFLSLEGPFQLPAGGLARCSNPESFNDFEGWGRLTWTGEADIQSYSEIRLRTIDTGLIDPPPPIELQFFAAGVMQAVAPSRSFAAAASSNHLRQSAFSIINPSQTEQARIELRLLDTQGEPAEIPLLDGPGFPSFTELRLGPLQSRRLLLYEILYLCSDTLSSPACPQPVPIEQVSLEGTLRVESDIPIALGGIDILMPASEIIYQEIPVYPLPE